MSPFTPQSWTTTDCTVDESSDDCGIQLADHLTITQAEDLLDWLESHGVRARDVRIESDGLMTVRWQS